MIKQCQLHPGFKKSNTFILLKAGFRERRDTLGKGSQEVFTCFRADRYLLHGIRRRGIDVKRTKKCACEDADLALMFSNNTFFL